MGNGFLCVFATFSPKGSSGIVCVIKHENSYCLLVFLWRPLESTSSFRRVYGLDIVFMITEHWNGRCIDLFGMSAVAIATRPQ